MDGQRVDQGTHTVNALARRGLLVKQGSGPAFRSAFGITDAGRAVLPTPTLFCEVCAAERPAAGGERRNVDTLGAYFLCAECLASEADDVGACLDCGGADCPRDGSCAPLPPPEAPMHTTMVQVNNVSYAINHNADWSGDAHVLWTDASGSCCEVTLPCDLLVAFSKATAVAHVRDTLIRVLEDL